MFSPDIVESEEFLDMPHSSQSLYFHLAMRADDDGFVQPKIIMRLIGANQDDLKVLISKRFLLPFESGVVVVKHWLIHNMIRADRYKETRFVAEKNTLFIKENKAYTDNPNKGKKLLATKWQPNDNHPAPQVRLGKVRLGKVSKERRPEHSRSYLDNIPDDDIQEWTSRFVVTEKQIRSTAENLKLYCERKGRTYKNYRSFLLNALKSEFKERDDEPAKVNKYANL